MTTAPPDDAVADAEGGEQGIDPDAPVLALPTELVLDEVARLRLERRLAAAPLDVLGVVALPSEIPPGSSARTAAERAAMRSAGDLADVDPGDVAGAVVLRPGVAHVVGTDSVRIDQGRLLHDRGALAHDPWRPVGRVEVASPDGRPPFRWRPIVLLLGLEPDLDLAETARALANALLVRDVEARLAVPAVPEGSYLTRPCLPVVESVRALDPDVVIALDPTAAAVASPWCDGNRSTTVVELTQDIAHDVQLVSWRIGVAQGRLRARVGRGVSSAALAQLANRLCSGPQPMPPPRSATGPRPGAGLERAVSIVRRGPTATSGPVTETIVAIGPTAGGSAPHLHALLRELGAAGSTIHRHTIDTVDPALLASVPLVLVSSSAGTDAIRLVDERRPSGSRRTLVDVEPADAVVPGEPDTVSVLRDGLEDLCTTGLVVAPSLAVAEAIRRAGGRTQVVPYLAERQHVAALDAAAEEREEPETPVIGWRIGHDGPPPAPVAAALVELLAALVAEGVHVQVVAGEGAVPDGLRAQVGLVIRAHAPSPGELASWTAQIWTPPAGWAALSGDLRGVVEAGFAGVPTVIGAADRPAVAGLADLDLVVEDVDRTAAWESAVRGMLQPDLRARRSARARSASVAIHGPDANRLRVARLTGWLRASGAT